MTALNSMYRVFYTKEGFIGLEHRAYLRKNALFRRYDPWPRIDWNLKYIPRYLRPQVVRLLVEEWVYPVEEETENDNEN